MFRRPSFGRNSSFLSRKNAPTRRSTNWLRSGSQSRRQEAITFEPLECRHMLSVNPIVWTDKPDYAPGETATFFGTGFQAGETIELDVTVLDGSPLAGQSIDTWQVVDGGPDDLDGTADGNIATHWIVSQDAENALLELTMTGLDSGLSGATNFTDAGPLFTTDVNGVEENQFAAKTDVYIDGGTGGPSLAPGQYFVRVTSPSGTLLGTSNVVAGGWDTTPVEVGANGEFVQIYQLFSIVRQASNTNLIGFDDTDNPGLQYRVSISQNQAFPPPQTQTFNFSVSGLASGATVSGFKFNDLNENGDWNQPEEPGLPGWTIFLDAAGFNGQLDWTDIDNNGQWDPGEGEQWTVTAADGSYSLENIFPGSYRLNEVQQQFWVATAGAGGIPLNLAANDTVDNQLFGNFFDESLVPDQFEPNNSIADATVLGSLQAVTLRDLTIHSPTDQDFFQFTPPQTGYTIINAFFTDADGDVDIQVLDENQQILAISQGIADNERIILPTIGQTIYYLRAYTADGASNVYDLEIEHFAAPIPTQVLIDPADDSGNSDGDNETNVQQPRIVVNADLSIFASQGGTVANSNNAVRAMWVEVVINDLQTGTVIETGVADPIGGNTLFEYTPANPLADGTYIVRSRTVSSDSQQTAPGPLSVGTLLHIDTTTASPITAVHNVTVSGGVAYSTSSQISFSGAAEAGSTVRVFFGSLFVGEAVAGPDESHPTAGLGRWQLVSNPVLDGTYTVEVEVLDEAGNSSGRSALRADITVDTVAPQRPTIDLLSAFDTGTSDMDDVTRLTQLNFRISAEPGSNVVIKDGNTVIRTINNFTPGPDGFSTITIDFTTLAPIASEGPHPLSIESTDTAGNRSAQSDILPLVIDTANPTFSAVTLANASNFPFTNISDVEFRGTAEAGAIIRIYANNNLVGHTVVGSDESLPPGNDNTGAWETTVGPLPDGTYTFRVEYEDLAGNISNFGSLFAGFIVDTVAPQRPTIDLLNEFDTGSSIFDNITNQTTLTFRISAEPGSDVVVKDGETVILTLSNFAPVDGFLDVVLDFDSLELSNGIPAEGPHLLSVESTDEALNRSAQAEELLVEIDTTIPILGTPAIFMLSSSDSGSSDSDGITNVSQPAFSGFVEANSIVRIYADRGNGPELVGVGTAGSDESDGDSEDGLGIWEITVEPLTDGDYTITFEVEDIAGNINNETPSIEITINTLSPQRPTLDLLDIDDTGSSNLDNVTRLSELRFRVSAEPGSRLVFKDGEVVIFEVANFSPGTDGFGFITIDFEAVENMFDIPAHGPHPLSVEAFDAAGNRSDQSEELLVTIDLLDPEPSDPDMLTSSDTGVSSSDNLTKIQTPAFWGVAEANTIVRIYANGELVGIATVGSDESIEDPDDPTNDPNGEIQPTEVTIGNITYSLEELEELGLGIWEITIEPLADGEYAMTTQIEDLAGNLSELSEPLNIVIDTTPPQRPTIDLIVPYDTGLSHFDDITRLTELTFRISAEPGTEVLVKDGETVILNIPNFIPGPGGFLDVVIDFNDVETNFAIPAEGPHPLSVESIDDAGNISAQAEELLVEIDTTEPFLGNPAIFLLSASDSGMSDSDGITNINQPAFSGYVEANTIVRIFADRGNGPELVGVGLTGSDESDGVLGDGLGIWEITVEPLTDGDYTITFEVEDIAGNVNRNGERTFDITVDTLPPQRPTMDLLDLDDTGSSNLDNVTRLSTLRFRVSAEPGSHVLIKDGEVVIYEIMNFSPGPDGFAIVTLDFLLNEANFDIPAHGPHPLSTEAFDKAGNRSHQSEELLVTIDLIDPEASQPDMLNSSDSGMFNDDNVTNIRTPAFWGVAEANTIIRIYANGELVGMTIVGSDESIEDPDGNGDPGDENGEIDPAAEYGIPGVDYDPEELEQLGLGIWEITIEPLIDGEYEITTVIEDLAGNLSPLSEPLTIWIDTNIPNTPVLDLITVSDSGRSNVDNITNDSTPTLQSTIFDPFNPAQLVFPNYLKYRIYDRIEGQPEVLLIESIVTQGGLLPNGAYLDTSSLLADGVHNLKLEVEDLAGNYSQDFLFQLIVDTVPPPGNGDLHPDSDTGVPGQLATFQDKITSDKSPTFFGTAEADAIVTVLIDGMVVGGTVATPLDGNQAYPEGQWQVRTNKALADGLHVVTFIFEDVAGNTSSTSMEIFVDTQGPKITNVAAGQISVGGVPSFDGTTTLSGIKPSTKADPLINSIVIDFIDQPPRVQQFLYDALNGILASSVGNYKVVGDHVGNVTIVQAIPTFTTVAGQPALATVELVFASPLPDDRFTLFVSDNLRDDPGNRLDGESNTQSPNGILPSGDGTPGGSFTARFTVDSRPEIGVYASTSIYLDINGNGVWDPFGVGNDFTNIDLVHIFGLPNDTRFAGKFSALKQGGGKVNTDGFDKLGAYGRVNGQFRWLIDTNNDGVVDLNIVDAFQLDGIPIAGNFDLNKTNGDEIGLFTGNAFYLDTNGDYVLDTKINSNLRGYPIAGDFDGDGFDDLATYSNNTFYFDFYAVGGWNGQIEDSYQFGFDGVVERPVAADLDQDGVDDIGLWAPGRSGVLPGAAAEWFFLISADRTTTTGKASTLKHPFSPVPLGTDLYYQFGDQFAIPLLGNFDPPTGDSEEEAPGIATTTVGLYDASKGTFFLRNDNSAGMADSMFGYGPAGTDWMAISGDWDGDGTATIGLYDCDTGYFYLRNSNSAGPADLMYSFGPGGDGWTPIVGDWDGDGIDTVGVYNGKSFFLRNSHSAGSADEMFNFGPMDAGWKPIVGDWDGNQTDTIGLYNGSAFFLRNSHQAGPADETFFFGPADNDWTPVTGDWDADGTTSVGLYNEHAFFLRNTHSNGPADITFHYGPTNANWTPLTGAWVGVGSPLLAAGTPAPGTIAQSLNSDVLASVVTEAVALWQAAGLDASSAGQLRSVDVRIADLSGNLLGLALGSEILIDINAAGFGWYSGIDPAGLAADDMDLLTVVAHEMGHLLGLDDVDASLSQALMAAELPAGVRREPTAADVDEAFAEFDDELLPIVG